MKLLYFIFLVALIGCNDLPNIAPPSSGQTDLDRFTVGGVPYDIPGAYISTAAILENTNGLNQHHIALVTPGIELTNLQDIYGEKEFYLVLGSIVTDLQYISPGTYSIGPDLADRNILNAQMNINGNLEFLTGTVKINRDTKLYSFNFDLFIESTRAEVKGDWKGYLEIID